jgi:hypothetical protein
LAISETIRVKKMVSKENIFIVVSFTPIMSIFQNVNLVNFFRNEYQVTSIKWGVQKVYNWQRLLVVGYAFTTWNIVSPFSKVQP